MKVRIPSERCLQHDPVSLLCHRSAHNIFQTCRNNCLPTLARG